MNFTPEAINQKKLEEFQKEVQALCDKYGFDLFAAIDPVIKILPRKKPDA